MAEAELWVPGRPKVKQRPRLGRRRKAFTPQETLEAEGHAVTAAHAGREGIEAFEAAFHAERAMAQGDAVDADEAGEGGPSGRGFQVVVTDLGMPHVDGRQVAAAVKALSPDTPVILLTGWGQRLVDDGEAKGVISGGEEDVANLALRLAISQMIAERAGQPLSLLVLDEIFGSLDDDRRAAVVELLRGLADRFPQVILITHIDTVRDGFDRIIRVSAAAKVMPRAIAGSTRWRNPWIGSSKTLT